MSKKQRYILEGEWSGYRSSQRRVCHRMVITNPDHYKKLTSILFTDGTTLDLTLRKCKAYEKVIKIDGYSDLINKCLARGVDRVQDLYKKKEV